MLEHDPNEPLAHFQLIEGLIGELLEGRLTADQMESLGRLLQADPQARNLYLRQITTHAMLQWELAQPFESDHGQAAEQEPVAPPPTDQSPASLPLADGCSPSPVLGFLGDIGRQGWGFVSEHTTLFSMLAALVLVAGLIAARVWKGNDGNRNPDAGSKIASHPSEISNPDRAPFGWLPAPSPFARLTRAVDGCWGHSVPALNWGPPLPQDRKSVSVRGPSNLFSMLVSGPSFKARQNWTWLPPVRYSCTPARSVPKS